jgi:transposase
MAWTAEHRRAADRRGLRYPSDLTDAEWALVAPLIRPAKHGGRPRTVDVREVLNAVFYVLSTGCQWSALPKDLPPKSTVWDYFSRWEWEGTIERIHHALYVAVREGRDARPARRRRSSTARRRRRRKKGLYAGSVRLRRGQEGRRPQAPPADRHHRHAARGDRASCQRAGS